MSTQQLSPDDLRAQAADLASELERQEMLLDGAAEDWLDARCRGNRALIESAAERIEEQARICRRLDNKMTERLRRAEKREAQANATILATQGAAHVARRAGIAIDRTIALPSGDESIGILGYWKDDA